VPLFEEVLKLSDVTL